MAGITELVDLVRLTRAKTDLTQPARIQRLSEFDTVGEFLSELDGEVPGVDEVLAEVEGWMDSPYEVTTILDERYPSRLKQAHNAPGIIFTLGNLVTDDQGVAVVGSREADERALKNTYAVAAAITQLGLSVVSGLAYGVDAVAHDAAVNAGGRTVAVIGTAIDRIYPKAHQGLQSRILGSGGMVLSQFEPGSSPGRLGFPMRNVVMSAYSLCTVVMAAQESSGTKHQCRAAIGHGRQVIFARSVLETASWAARMVNNGQAKAVGSLDEALNEVVAVRDRRMQVAWEF